MGLGETWREQPSSECEYGADVQVGALATGSTHDECSFHLEPVSDALKNALVETLLQYHVWWPAPPGMLL